MKSCCQCSKKCSLNKKMAIALIAGIACGVTMLLFKTNLLANGQADLWKTINSFLFADITAEGNETALGLFYVVGQLFVRALQLVIIPMVFTSIVTAMIRISDSSKLGRISRKTLGFFLLTTVVGILFAGTVGFVLYRANFFRSVVTGLEASSGSIGKNPLNILINAVPNNLIGAFSNNGGVLAVVVLATFIGLLCNQLGDKVKIIPEACKEVSELITAFLRIVINQFAPVAIFCLLTRTFASYGIAYLSPAISYILVTTVLLLAFLTVGYSLFVKLVAKISPKPFLQKITKVALFGFSTSSSAATLPLNLQVTETELGVKEDVASFVLPLGMTVNMDGTAIMQIMATIFIAGCAGYPLTFTNLLLIGTLTIVASVGTPAAPGAGAVILFTILSGVGFTNEVALTAYSLILAINRPIEMLVTALNVVGDSACAVAVAKSEGDFDQETYFSEVKKDA